VTLKKLQQKDNARDVDEKTEGDGAGKNTEADTQSMKKVVKYKDYVEEADLEGAEGKEE
jgi:hypothetical protein